MNPDAPNTHNPNQPNCPFAKLRESSIFRWYKFGPETDTFAFSPPLGQYSRISRSDPETPTAAEIAESGFHPDGGPAARLARSGTASRPPLVSSAS